MNTKNVRNRPHIRRTIRHDGVGVVDDIPFSGEPLTKEVKNYLENPRVKSVTGVFLAYLVDVDKKLEDINNSNFQEILHDFKDTLLWNGYTPKTAYRYVCAAKQLVWFFRASKEGLPISFHRLHIPKNFFSQNVEKAVETYLTESKPFVRFMLDSKLTPKATTKKDLSRYEKLLSLLPHDSDSTRDYMKAAKRLFRLIHEPEKAKNLGYRTKRTAFTLAGLEDVDPKNLHRELYNLFKLMEKEGVPLDKAESLGIPLYKEYKKNIGNCPDSLLVINRLLKRLLKDFRSNEEKPIFEKTGVPKNEYVATAK